VQTELGLTDDQKKAVSAAVASALSGGAVGDPAINPPNAAQLGGGMVPGVGVVEPGDPHRRAAAALAEVAAGFTTAQASRWKELAGEKVGFNVTRVTNQCQAVFGQLPAAATGDEGLTVPPAPPILPPPALPNAPLPQLPPPAVAPPALTPLAPPPAQLPPPAAPVKK
jgi:hypothetical protein